MTSPVTVSISIKQITGTALPRARVTFERTAADMDGAIIAPAATTVTCEADGTGSASLMPNTTGSESTQYRVTIVNEHGELQYSGLATVPATNSDLHTLLGLASPAATSDVGTVAGIAANVTTVAGIAANVTTVAGIAADVTTVAGIAADVTSAATNMAAIQAAPQAATDAEAALDQITTLSNPEIDYWTMRAAMLDPAALVMKVRSGFDYTPANDIYVLNAWACAIGSARYDHRSPPGLGSAFVLPSGTRVQGNGASTSTFVAIDPSLVTYPNPKAKFYERLARIPSLPRQILYQSLAAGIANGNKVQAFDQTRAYWNTGTKAAGDASGRGLSTAQYAASPFDLPIAVAAGTFNIEVGLFRNTGYTGAVSVEVVADNAGSPTGASMGTGTIAEAALPPTTGVSGRTWVACAVTLSSPLVAGTRYWVVLHGANASPFSAVFASSRGSSGGTYEGKYSDNSGSTWALSGAGYALRIGHAAEPKFLIVQVNCFDSSWVIVSDAFNRTGVNLWNEISDADPIRYTHEPYMPWDLQYGMHWAMNKVAATQTNATLTVVELPTDW